MFIILSPCGKSQLLVMKEKEKSKQNSFGSIVIEGVEDSGEIK